MTKVQKTVLMVFTFGFGLLAFVLPVLLRPWNFLADDTYFYLQVAHNIVGGYGSTFNQITTTNGYHPLWMGFVVLGTFIAGNDKMLVLRIIPIMQTIIFLGIVLYFIKIAKLVSLKYWIVGIPILATYFLTGLYASEAHINGLMVMIASYYLLYALTSTERLYYWSIAGVFIGLTVLARLDNIFLSGSFILFGYIGQLEKNNRRNYFDRKKIIRIVALLLPFLGVFLPYLVYNFLFYGHFVPISGAIKSSFPQLSFNISHLGWLGQITAFFSLISITLSLSKRQSPKLKILFAILGTGIVLHTIYIILFSNGGWTRWYWYYVSGVINFTFVICYGFDIAFSQLQQKGLLTYEMAGKAARGVMVALIVGGLLRGWFKYSSPDVTRFNPIFMTLNKSATYPWPVEVALWMKENLPDDSGLFAYDAIGKIAWYSDMKILPEDGLINDYSYNDEILNLGINQYLQLNNVKYYLGPLNVSSTGVQQVEIDSPLYKEAAGCIRLSQANIVVRIKDITNNMYAPDWAIWRIN